MYKITMVPLARDVPGPPALRSEPKRFYQQILLRTKLARTKLFSMDSYAMDCRLWRYIYVICIFTEALITYSAPRGGDMQSMTGGARFEDLSYDGVMRDGILKDGLGQMTDSFTGPNDFELPEPYDTRGKKSGLKVVGLLSFDLSFSFMYHIFRNSLGGLE